jgi:hypothetical protein
MLIVILSACPVGRKSKYGQIPGKWPSYCPTRVGQVLSLTLEALMRLSLFMVTLFLVQF